MPARTTRRPLIIAVAAAALITIVVSAYALRTTAPPPVAVTPAPGVSATVPASPTPTVTPAAAATPSPSGAAGRYVNAAMRFSIDLRAPWRRATCGSTALGPADGAEFATDLFVPVPDRDVTFGGTGGPPVDQIVVTAQANPRALTPRQWKESGRAGAALGETVQDTTLAGRQALLVSERENETTFVADAGYMYTVSHQARSGVTGKAERVAIVRSFQFLTAEEARAAASPTPAPRSPEAVASALADGFARKDTGSLARVAARCPGEGPDQAGIARRDAQSYLEAIRDRFARGLTVEVLAHPVATRADAPAYFFVRAVWREPGQPERDSDLRIVVEGSTAYWDTVVYYPGGRP